MPEDLKGNLDLTIIPSKSGSERESISNLSALTSVYYDGRHYELLYKHNYISPELLKFDIPFWIEMAEQYGDSVLELCCGEGRISVPLAQEGFQVTGIDLLESMLSKAKKICSQVRWINANVCNFDLNEKFSLIIFPFNSLGHLLELEAIESCFSCVQKHLKPEGKFIIDLENSCSQENIAWYLDQSRQLFSVYPDPDGKGTVAVTYQNDVDFNQQVNRAKLFFRFLEQEEEVIQEVPYRLFFPQEIEALLKYSGFTVEKKFGGHDRSLFTSQSANHILVCRLQ
jgi:SAM-dependent methyltransferase